MVTIDLEKLNLNSVEKKTCSKKEASSWVLWAWACPPASEALSWIGCTKSAALSWAAFAADSSNSCILAYIKIEIQINCLNIFSY